MLEERYRFYKQLKKLRLRDVKLSLLSTKDFHKVSNEKLLNYFRQINNGYFEIDCVPVKIECEFPDGDSYSPVIIQVDNKDVELGKFQSMVHNAISGSTNVKQHIKFLEKISKVNPKLGDPNLHTLEFPRNSGILSDIGIDDFMKLTLNDVTIIIDGLVQHDKIKDELLYLHFFNIDSGKFMIDDIELRIETDMQFKVLEFKSRVTVDGEQVVMHSTHQQLLNNLIIDTQLDVIVTMLSTALSHTSIEPDANKLALEVTST